ncbi:MAG: hypothetical protein HZB16_09000 [Armatimonadetes bacterium]|nr:hypothetical protein [Armatimonadota bacterium]
MRALWTWLRHELDLKLASLVIALVLCAWRSNVANPMEKRWYPSMTVEARNLHDGLVLVTRPAPATVVLRGPRRLLDRLSQEHQVQPVLDLTGLAQPTWKWIKVNVVKLPPGVEQVDVQPPEQLVEVDAAERQAKNIQADLGSSQPARGYAAEAPHLDAATAEVSGPRRSVNRVAHLTAAVDVGGAKDTVTGEARLIPVDAVGQRVTGVECKPLTVSYTVKVVALRGAQAFTVAPRVSGQPAAGYEVTESRAEPAMVVLSGPRPALATLAERIETEPVDVTGWKQSSERRVALALPAGISAQPREVAVVVTLTARRPGP